ncbi:MAG: type I restriction-modification enzyme R subunit C-terminal domain-containing protein [Bacteroidota bacterium]|nr:type I restriction-modification enzyme R subunit C-terminal domain-containing protein [Bacteroidota bacterium]
MPTIEQYIRSSDFRSLRSGNLLSIQRLLVPCLEVKAAKQAFAEILNNQTLNSQQIRFMDTIIDFLTAKGMIEPKMLFDSPFMDINTSGIAGVFDEEMSVRIIGLLEGRNRNVEVG